MSWSPRVSEASAWAVRRLSMLLSHFSSRLASRCLWGKLNEMKLSEFRLHFLYAITGARGTSFTTSEESGFITEVRPMRKP